VSGRIEEHDQEDELGLGLADLPTRRANDPAHEPGRDRQHDRHRYDEEQQVAVEVREEGAEREDGPEVRDEAGREDDLAQAGLVQARLDHDRVDDRDRRGRERDAGDLCGSKVPADDPSCEGHREEEGEQEGDEADGERLLPVVLDDRRFDLRAGEEGQQATAEPGQEVDPGGAVEFENVARDDADDDLDEGDRQAGAACDDRSHEGQTEPDCCDGVRVAQLEASTGVPVEAINPSRGGSRQMARAGLITRRQPRQNRIFRQGPARQHGLQAFRALNSCSDGRRGMATGTFSGKAKRVRIYVDEGQLHKHQSLPVAILGFLRKEGAAGATVFRGIEGFGGSGEIHTARLVDINQRLPMVIDWIDTPEQVERLLPQVKEMIRHGFITVDDTEVALFCPSPVRDVASALRAADVMSREVISVTPDTSVRKVVEFLVGKSYRAIPVTKEGMPIGIITNSDLLKRAGLTIRVGLLPSLDTPLLHAELERLAQGGKTAESVMTPGPVTVNQAMPLTQVAEIMAYRHLKRLPVVDDHGAMVGMISRLDVLRTAAHFSERAQAEPRDIGLAVDAPVAQSMRRDVPTVFLDTPLPEVLQAVVSTRLNRCVVVDSERRVMGKVTDAEVLERVTPALRPSALRSLMHRLPFVHSKPDEARAEQHASARVAADLMVETAVVREDAPLREAIGSMLGGQHKIIAVVDADKRLVGCLDRADLLRGLLSSNGFGT
jgi:CBS domain-containing protein